MNLAAPLQRSTYIADPSGKLLKPWVDYFSALSVSMGGASGVDLSAVNARLNAAETDIVAINIALAALSLDLANEVDQLRMELATSASKEQVTRAMLDELRDELEMQVIG
ncbi:hypothetical protein CBM2586_B10187 [Cupriavidus phytorum]|uniref:Uncharacterized protein n=1 Tax=Cupriavidus taiwanensis TaxID=164546 RepID=A0A375C915_9BURK|nr:hypothetical protein [Cupriavidus taiwanensis]SOY65592.1 hypothetical protein CBM2586_B10187 [Cupriavidus taiwanensis]